MLLRFQQLFITLLAVAQSARLDNKYLPPPASAASAGGGPGLQGPGGSNFGLGGFSGAGGPSRPIGGGGAPGGFSGGSSPGGGFGGGGRPGPSGPAQPSGPPIPILSYVNENDGDGNYRFSYETGNGIKAEEEGTIKNKGSENEIASVMGTYSYTNPEGQLVEISYIADENGFQPSGDALPTPPPIPEEIAKSLAAQGISVAPGGGYTGGPGTGAGGELPVNF